MRKLGSVAGCLGGLLVVLVAPPVSAAYVDFRAASGNPNGKPSWSYTEPETGVVLTVTPSLEPPQPSATVKLWWDSTDGFGVASNAKGAYEADEVEGPERLTISFSDPVYLSNVYLTDLFNEWGYLEQGSYVLSDGTVGTFKADTSQIINKTNGEKTLTINALATSITFSAPGMNGQTNKEFSVAGLTFSRSSAVPELDPRSAGGGLGLLTCGLLIVLGRRRRENEPE